MCGTTGKLSQNCTIGGNSICPLKMRMFQTRYMVHDEVHSYFLLMQYYHTTSLFQNQFCVKWMSIACYCTCRYLSFPSVPSSMKDMAVFHPLGMELG